MGVFNNLFGRNNREDEIRAAQREEQEINRRFREESIKKMEEYQETIFDLSQRMKKYETEIKSLKREKRHEDNQEKRNIDLEVEAREEQRRRLEEERRERENASKMSLKDYEEAKKIIEKMQMQIGSYIKEKDVASIEKLEKKLRENILIFKQRFLEGKYEKEAIKRLKIAREIIYEIGNFYYNSQKYSEALSYFQEYQNFDIEQIGFIKTDNVFAAKFIRCCYKCGKYDEIEEILKDYGNENPINMDEQLLKAEVYMNIGKKDEVKEVFEKIENYLLSCPSEEEISKVHLDKYCELMEKFVLNNLKGNSNILKYLFFNSLYRKRVEKISELLNKTEEFENKEFFKGVVLLKNNNYKEASVVFSKYLDKLYGILYYVESIKNNISLEDIRIIDEFIEIELETSKKDEFLIFENYLLNKKYEILGYKLEYFLKNQKDKINECLIQIKELLEKDNRPKIFKGRGIFWISIIRTIEYLKKIDSSLREDFEKILKSYVNLEEIKGFEKMLENEETEVDIDEEYKISKEKNNLTLYSEMECIHKITKVPKVYIEVIENLNEAATKNVKYKLKKDQLLSEQNEHFVKIDNFSVNDNKVQIIIEDYCELFEERKQRFSTMSWKAKFKEAYELVTAFEELKKNNIFMKNFNIDNFVWTNKGYKFRFVNYSLGDTGSLTQTKSILRKKLNKYRTPENSWANDTISNDSNIFILGMLFYELFYGNYILSDIINEKLQNISIFEEYEIKEAFFEDKPVNKDLVTGVSEKRFRLEDKEKNTVYFEKVISDPYIPEKITSLLKEMLDKIGACRPTLEEIKERLEETEYNLGDYSDYIPEIVEKEDFTDFIGKLSEEAEKIIVRDKKLQNILPGSIVDTNSCSLIIVEKKDRVYEISDMGKFYSIALRDENETKTERISIEELKEKIETIKDDDCKEFAKQNKISEEKAEIFIFSVEQLLADYEINGILKFESRDKESFQDIPTIDKDDLMELFKTNDWNKLLNILKKLF